jgi:LacI family transcriptional regulator
LSDGPARPGSGGKDRFELREPSAKAGLDPVSPVSKWYQLKSLLLRQIEQGRHDPETVFCNQQELMDHYGVSYATVSRALSELVREGYLYRKRGVGTFIRPKVERRGTSGTIGMLVWDREHMLEHPAYSRVVAGISEPLRSAGYNLQFIFVNVSAELSRPGCVAEIVRRADVRALIAPRQPMLGGSHLQPLADEGMVIVPLNLDVPSLGPCAVHFDISGAIEMATAHLLACGYRHTALMIPEDEEAPARMAGYRRALQMAGVEEELIFTDPRKRPLGPEVQRILGTLSAPAGIVANDDIAALTTIRAAREAGWSVPEQLGVVGVGDVLPPELFEAPLTTVHVPFVDMGRIASEMTMALLEGKTPNPPVRYLTPRLVVRSTTTQVNGTPQASGAPLAAGVRRSPEP